MKSELQIKDQHIKILEETVKNLERRFNQQQVQQQLEAKQESKEDSKAEPQPEEQQTLTVLPEETQLSQTENLQVDDSAVRLISLISIYLSIHRAGTHFDGIVDFVRQSDASAAKENVEKVLRDNPQLFTRCADSTSSWRFKLFFQ